MQKSACFTLILSLAFSCFDARTFAHQKTKDTPAPETSLIRTRALKINVDDMEKAVSFYCDKLGFQIEDRKDYPKQVILKTGERIQLILNKVEKLRKAGATDTQVGLTLQVNDLDQAIIRMKAAGVEFADNERRKEGVGYAISIRDPFGRRISLMHQTIVKVEPFKEPRIYNFGLLIPDMKVARDFYGDKLGFVVRSERYLPLDLPLGHRDNSFGFMLHFRPGVKSIKSSYPKTMPFYTIVFETDSLEKVVDVMTSKGIRNFSKKSPKKGEADVLVFEDPFGNISELVETNG